MNTTKERYEEFKKRHGDEAKTVLLKLWKGRIKVAKQSIGKSKKRLDGTGTIRGYSIQKPTAQDVIDLYKERIENNEKIIRMWEQKIEELEKL